MPSNTFTQGPSPVDDFGLDAVQRHNAAISTEDFQPYHDEVKGLGIYVSFASVSFRALS